MCYSLNGIVITATATIAHCCRLLNSIRKVQIILSLMMSPAAIRYETALIHVENSI